MIKFRVVDGALWQWDLGRKIAVSCDDSSNISEIHFSNPGSNTCLIVIPEFNGNEFVANIPNILLESPQTLEVYAVVYTDDGERTYAKYATSVKQRQKPDDYVYTETDVMNYSTLNKRMDEFELTNAKVVSETVNSALLSAKESGEFDGKDGKDYILTESDKQEIAGIAEGEWIDIADITTTEEVNSIYVSKDMEGNAFNCKKLYATLIMPYAFPALRQIYFGGSGDYAFDDPYYAFNVIYYQNVRHINVAIEIIPDKCVKMDYQMNVESEGFSSDLPNGSVIKPTARNSLYGFRIAVSYDGINTFPAGTTLKVWGLKK